MPEDTISPVLWDYSGYTAMKLNALWQYHINQLWNAFAYMDKKTWRLAGEPGWRGWCPETQSDYLTEGFKQ
jgi:hypothetical protein